MKGWSRDWSYQDAVERVAETHQPPTEDEQEVD